SYARAFGDSYLRDLTRLRAGEIWRDGLRDLIRHADVFQLFWSSKSMVSSFVRSEWEYAVTLNRPFFIRPVYWETPLPSLPGLPPEQLLRMHFQLVRPRAPGGAAGSRPAPRPAEPSVRPAPAAPPLPRSAPEPDTDRQVVVRSEPSARPRSKASPLLWWQIL